jgi:hypothetical protein
VLKTALARSDAMTAEDERGRTPAAS